MDKTYLDNWEKRLVSWLEMNASSGDASHDISHFKRVWRTASYINDIEAEKADPLVLLVSSFLHDIVSLPKDHPQRHISSRLSAEKAVEIINSSFPDFPEGLIPELVHAIHAHSFSANVIPLTTAARILQDADRMDALGAIGLARVFYIAGLLKQGLFDPEDPMAENRPLDDKSFAFDHFQTKLLKLPDMMNTASGRALANERAEYLIQFMRICKSEILGWALNPQANLSY